jgi:hypothetical protein
MKKLALTAIMLIAFGALLAASVAPRPASHPVECDAWLTRATPVTAVGPLP